MSKTDQLITLLKKEKIKKKTIDAFQAVDRKKFFDPIFHKDIYSGAPVPVGHGQSSDDAVSLGKMIDLLQPKKSWRLLEVGTGSGFSTALLSPMVSSIVTIEHIEPLALRAKDTLTRASISNVTFYAGDVSDISSELGTFDGIIVLAGCRQTPYKLLECLKPGGSAVFPMGPRHQQQIVLYKNNPDSGDNSKNYSFHDLCEFESIRGEFGWIDIIEGYIVDDDMAEE